MDVIPEAYRPTLGRAGHASLDTAEWSTAAADEEVVPVRAVSCQAALQGVRVEADAHQVCELADAAGQVGDRHLVAQGEDVGPVALGPPAGDVLRPGPAGGGEPPAR